MKFQFNVNLTINKAKSWFFEEMKKKRARTQFINITTYATDILKVIENVINTFMPKLDNFIEMDTFLGKHYLSKQIQEEVKDLDSSISIREIESVI